MENITLINVIIIFEISLNLFLHIVQIKKHCDNEISDYITRLIGNIEELDSTVDTSKRFLQQLHQSNDEIQNLKEKIQTLDDKLNKAEGKDKQIK